jgi:hypothetical protein
VTPASAASIRALKWARASVTVQIIDLSSDDELRDWLQG